MNCKFFPTDRFSSSFSYLIRRCFGGARSFGVDYVQFPGRA